jgi:activating signal cointegrator complex subunit 1
MFVFFFFIVRAEEPVEDDDDAIDYLSKENMYVCEMDVAPAFYGVLIGKNGENKQKIEQDTNTQIIFPRRDETGTVKIKSRTKANVQSARTRIEIAIERNRQIQPFTHFLSIPICQSSSSNNLKDKFEEFKKNVLEQCSNERGITAELFQQPTKLHLTIATLVLLSKSEIDFIKDTLQDCTKTLLQQLMPTDKERFIVQIKGLEFMNDDPSFVDVLYAKVQLIDQINSNRLETFLNRLNEDLLITGLMKQKFERIKLHVTLMNSLLRKDDTGILEAQKTARGRVKNHERESFDAKKILQLFSQFDFGQIELNELHLSIMHQPDRQTGYYGCETKILLKPM